ncbi:hypothetical protein, partial [Bacillus subtilis]|uniref:hypothetical protein n=1 Tax=Bacillus subtilis TaxID=1423 RepID=UPI001BDBAE49
LDGNLRSWGIGRLCMLIDKQRGVRENKEIVMWWGGKMRVEFEGGGDILKRRLVENGMGGERWGG